MKLTFSFILIVLVASGFCEDTTSTTSSITTDASTTSVQTDSTVTTETTTAKQPDTTTMAPSTTTDPSTTSTTADTTTDVSTTSSLPDTTTPNPTTMTPTPSPTPTSAPPTPVDGSWNVTEGNLTCIRADLKIRFKIFAKDRIDYIILSPNATSGGSCQLTNNTQELSLEDSEYKLTMIFEKDSNDAYVKNITFSYNLPGDSGMVYNDTRLFSVKLGNSYMCDSSSDVILRNVTMEVYRIHVQSFGNAGNKDFGTAEECAADNKVNDMVPIAVGIALLCLVVVVLIAYFVGRRRSRQKGYQSV